MERCSRMTENGDVGAANHLLVEIARCPVADACFDSPESALPCSQVVHAQGTGRDAFHVPEPWSGDIERAPILFVSWNPSWNPDEPFPTSRSSDSEIMTFFRHRFEHTHQDSHTWREMDGMARHLLGRDAERGVDWVVTDIVHCKSLKGTGAFAALEECAGRYLPRVLALAGATAVVGLGRDARSALARHFGVPPEIGVYSVADEQRPSRVLVLLGAPGAAQRRRLLPDELSTVESALAQRAEDDAPPSSDADH